VNLLNIRNIAVVVLLSATCVFAQKVDKTAKIGAGLYEVVFNEKDNAVYVAATGKRGEKSAKIYKLNPQTLEVVSTIDVSEAPAYGLGLNGKTQTLYSSNTNSNSVHAIDLKTGKVLATINSGKDKSHTREVLVDETANKVYVTNMSDVWVIDGATNKFESVIEGLGEGVTGAAINSAKQILYVTNMGNQTTAGKVTAYDLKAKKVINTFESGGKGAINLVYDAKGKRLFVANQGDGNVTVLDESGKLLQTISTGAGALGISYNPVKNLLYVANRGAGTTSVIDAKTYKIVADLKTGSSPQTIAIDKKSGRVFVTNKTAPRPRPQAGQPAPTTPPAEDPNGDVVTVIVP
jgi:YVTN family beta-propeller protein